MLGTALALEELWKPFSEERALASAGAREGVPEEPRTDRNEPSRVLWEDQGRRGGSGVSQATLKWYM